MLSPIPHHLTEHPTPAKSHPNAEPRWPLQIATVKGMESCVWPVPVTLVVLNFENGTDNLKLEGDNCILPEEPNGRYFSNHSLSFRSQCHDVFIWICAYYAKCIF